MASKLKTAILGATGYSGFELARILLRHPGVETPVMLQRFGESAKDANLADMYPAISGNGGYPLQPWSWAELQRQKIELLFLATPHEVSRALVPEAIAHGLRVVDLSGAWRLRQAQNRAVYGFHDADAVTAADLMEKAVYGLPGVEWRQASRRRSGGQSRLLCHFRHSGSGPAAGGGHRRSREGNHFRFQIRRFRRRQGGNRAHPLCFGGGQSFRLRGLRAPPRGRNSRAVETGFERADFHSAPAADSAGNSFHHLRSSEARDESRRKWNRASGNFIEGKPWVRVFATPKLPEIQFSLHTNYCDLGFCLAQDGRRLVLVSCIDNLLKGAAGQAVQNMNLMYGFKEQDGLQ